MRAENRRVYDAQAANIVSNCRPRTVRHGGCPLIKSHELGPLLSADVHHDEFILFISTCLSSQDVSIVFGARRNITHEYIRSTFDSIFHEEILSISSD